LSHEFRADHTKKCSDWLILCYIGISYMCWKHFIEFVSVNNSSLIILWVFFFDKYKICGLRSGGGWTAKRKLHTNLPDFILYTIILSEILIVLKLFRRFVDCSFFFSFFSPSIFFFHRCFSSGIRKRRKSHVDFYELFLCCSF